ncbi:MAG: hypothetical protein ABI689_04970 [Thermoanaerobaculia bacterium]
MKTTIELPDPLLRQAKAAAAARGESLRELLSTALRSHLAGSGRGRTREEGWRQVFGKAPAAAIAELEEAMNEFEKIDPADWR